MIDAVLFDWGNTLSASEWSEALAREGNEEGLAAIGRAGLPAADAIGKWWTAFLAAAESSEDEIDVAARSAECFTALGCPLEEDEVARYVEATQRHWTGAAAVHPDTPLLLDELRRRGLELAVVSNSATPGGFLHAALEEQGIASRIDAAVFSSVVGKRKPHPAIFRAALEALGVAAERALFVGDRPYEDVLGARDAGMKTVQATWFGAVHDPRGAEPDFTVHEPLDVLELVTTLQRRAA